MNKKAIFAHYSEIIDNMLKESLFWDTYFQKPYYLESIEGSIDDPAIPEGLSINFGISRGCIIDEDYDYVVKFNIENDAYYDDLSAREVEISNYANEQGLSRYFAKAEYLGTYHKEINFYDIKYIERNLNWCDYNPSQFDEDFMEHEEEFGPVLPILISIPLYVYPRAERYTFTMLPEAEEIECQTKARQIASPLRKRNIQIAMEFIHKYGMEEYERLTDFLFENDINDLHYGNVMNINGDLCIIDYAGFHSGYGEEESTIND